MTDDADASFADAPISITEARAGRVHDAAQWTPRDALVDLLRRIDRGEVNVKQLVIAYAVETGDGGTASKFSAAGTKGLLEGLGLLQRASHLLQQG